MKKLVIAVLLMVPLVGCGQNLLEERHEHGDVTCVYRVHTNFWGQIKSERVVACK